ncbi:MAG TPA: hypothetical protein VGB53_01285 [Rubricoccaceae bacterium]|jgi:hypothetical protein
MRSLLVLALGLSAAASAQVRTSDAPLAGSAGAALGYLADVGWLGPAVGAELATEHMGAAASLTFPGDETARAFSLAAFVYPGGRRAPVAVALGAEYDIVAGGGQSTALLGPIASVSYRLVHQPEVSVVPEVAVGLLFPVTRGYGRDAGLNVAATASVAIAAQTVLPGVRVSLTPAVSRSVNLDRSYDRAAYAASITVGLTSDL